MIAGIGAYGSLQGLYPQYSKKKVTPVKAVKEERGSLEEINKKNSSEQNKIEDAITTNYKAKLAESTKEQNAVSYDTSNPYNQFQKSLDESFLVGMNIDVVA